MSNDPLLESLITDWETTLRYGFALAQLRTGSEEAAFVALTSALDEVWSEDEAAIPTRQDLMVRVARHTEHRRSA